MRAILLACLLMAACGSMVQMTRVPAVHSSEGRQCLQNCQGLYNQCTWPASLGSAVALVVRDASAMPSTRAGESWRLLHNVPVLDAVVPPAIR